MEGKDVFTHEEAKSHARFHVETLARLLHEYFTEPGPVFDFGCGDGWYLRRINELRQGSIGESAASLGSYDLIGLEGTANLVGIAKWPRIIHPVDLGQQIVAGFQGHVMSIEVGEHLPEAKLNAFVDNLVRHCKRKLVLTWAVRGQAGRRHISCRNADEVIPWIESKGFFYLKEYSQGWRDAIRANEEPRFHYMCGSLYVFERKS